MGEPAGAERKKQLSTEATWVQAQCWIQEYLQYPPEECNHFHNRTSSQLETNNTPLSFQDSALIYWPTSSTSPPPSAGLTPQLPLPTQVELRDKAGHYLQISTSLQMPWWQLPVTAIWIWNSMRKKMQLHWTSQDSSYGSKQQPPTTSFWKSLWNYWSTMPPTSLRCSKKIPTLSKTQMSSARATKIVSVPWPGLKLDHITFSNTFSQEGIFATVQ